MKGSSKIIVGVASLMLSASSFAFTTSDNIFYRPVNDVFTGTGHFIGNTFFPNMNNRAGYMVSDVNNSDVRMLDGVNHGQVVSASGDMYVASDAYRGSKITNLTTKKSGIITGIKHQGTMDVMGNNGKITRYQYVTFKVKHI